MAKKKLKCEICSSIIKGRGAKRFCSKYCRNKGHSKYFESKRVPNVRHCHNELCDKEITEKRSHYCSEVCRRKSSGNRFKHIDCIECGSPLTGNKMKFCSNPCRAKYSHKNSEALKESARVNLASASSHPNSLKARSETMKRVASERVKFWKENPEEWDKHFKTMQEGKLNGGNKINKGLRSVPVTYVCRKGRFINLRSILELRFAIQADNNGWDWEYEPDLLKEGDGHCIPDFWVEDENCYYEVKPHSAPEIVERYKSVAEQNDVVIEIFTKEDVDKSIKLVRLNKGDHYIYEHCMNSEGKNEVSYST
jgi:hypothetical protein